MASSGHSTPYHNRIDTDMDCNPTIEELSPEYLELSYETEQEKALWVGMVANHQKTMRPSQPMPLTKMMLLISNFHTTLRPLPNQNYGVVLSIPFFFTVPLSTLLQTPRISKLPSISWPNTFKTNKLMVVRVTTSMISMVWVMPSATSSRQSMWLDGIYCTLVKRSSHRGGSPQNGLRDERTCGTTLASAYVLSCLSAAWSQLQMKERKSRRESLSGSEY